MSLNMGERHDTDGNSEKECGRLEKEEAIVGYGEKDNSYRKCHVGDTRQCAERSKGHYPL